MRFLLSILVCIGISALLINSCSTDNVDPDCTPGSVCDDGDANTSGDIYDADCRCKGTPITVFDLGSNIQADIGGRVMDEAGQPLAGVAITIGSKTTTTDELGVFLIQNATVKERLAYVEASLEGYFDGSRSFLPTDGINKVNIRMLTKQDAGSVDATVGGLVQSEGVKINFDGAFMKNGSAYTGQVNVAMNYINPTDENFEEEMPGTLLGVQDGNGQVLTSFGMVAAELTDNMGAKVDLATGTTAEVRFPVPSSMLSSAPAEIDLWYFDENSGYWVSEGKATLIGNEYVGQVSHFSFWNCDVPNDFIYLDGRIVNGAGNGVDGVEVTVTSGTLGSSSDWTDSEGYFGGYVPNDEVLDLTIWAWCDEILEPYYTELIGPFSTNITLEDITVSIGTYVTGTAEDCDGNTPSSGYVAANGEVYYLNNGAFSFTACGSSVTITAYNTSNGWEAGVPQNINISGGTQNVDTLTACEGACSDGLQNGDETGVDCGGSECISCAERCDDGIQNGDETGVDCGGADCDACPTCSDGIQNGNETGVDCGGSCEPCPTCDDGIQNGDETGVDCGGSFCESCPPGSVTDIDGNTYTTVVIGTQEWMAENLRTTRYQNGDAIPNVTGGAEWDGLTTGAFCWYDNDDQFEEPYGKLYNWYAVDDNRNVCPESWHVPTDAEWTVLKDYLGVNAGGKMKSTGTLQAGTGLWIDPNFGATNESGFTGLPGGGRYGSGNFGSLGYVGNWWSATEYSASYAWLRNLDYSDANVDRNDSIKGNGFSVRCVRD